MYRDQTPNQERPLEQVEMILEAAQRLEKHAREIPAWRLGTIVFAEVGVDRYSHG